MFHDDYKHYFGEDFDEKKWFAESSEEIQKAFEDKHKFPMNVQTIAYVVGTVIVLLLLLSCCCRRKRNQGQVILVPPAPPAPAAAPYPQQQYTQPVVYPVVTTYPTQNPNVSYPSVAPYPTGGAPYPTGGSPYPPGGSPYPPAGSPYPPAGPGPHHAAPSAPDVNVLPPTYEQATGAEYKQAPYNPAVPH